MSGTTARLRKTRLTLDVAVTDSGECTERCTVYCPQIDMAGSGDDLDEAVRDWLKWAGWLGREYGDMSDLPPRARKIRRALVRLGLIR